MDADCIDNQRDQLLSRREKRWSMNSQRLEEIVAELMKPISDARRNFDTDLSALLEEYLTEAGLRALDVGEEASAEDALAPNFAELALLLQQSATIYGRKVDFLYQHVLDISEAVPHSAPQPAPAQDEAAARRRRRVSVQLAGEFARVQLRRHAGAARERPARPPPTLPRMYMELEPRVITDADAPLHDYAGEAIGLLADFQVTWRLHRGMLVDVLEDGLSNDERALRPISLVELQAAIEAAAPPLPAASPHYESFSPHPLSSPLRTSTPLPTPLDPPADPDMLNTPGHTNLPPPTKRERKRRSEININYIVEGSMKIAISEDLRRRLSDVEEFSIPAKWIKKVVEKRKSDILSERRKQRVLEPDPRAKFPGWSPEEAATAAAAVKNGRLSDSDDDGFFERSSVASELSRASDAQAECGAAGTRVLQRAAEAQAECGAWRSRVLQRAAEAEARGGLDVRALAARVLGALPPDRARPFPDVLRAVASEPPHVSHVLLASLFLANAGNVQVLHGAPLSLDSFSLRLLSSDDRLYSAVAAEDR